MRKIVFILFTISVFSPDVFCQEIGKIVSLQGRVDIFKDDCQSAIPAREDEPLSVGDSIRTKSGSKAQILFNDKSILKIAQNSKALIEDYRLDEKDKRKTALIKLSRGKARAIIARMPHSADFVIATPNAKGIVKGSDVTVFYQAGNSGMFVSEGKLSVINIAHPGSNIVIPKGNACLIPMDELPKGPRPYLDAEKNVNDEDTDVPVSISKTGTVSVIKGAVTKISGSVKITPKGSAEAHKASINDILGEGDRVETGENGCIEIRLDNNNAINLKPNTKLTIIKLVINPNTGEFENIFEVTIGKIKARIENLKGNSKFEVKTPMAVCGARGTIMYVDVTQILTTSFFEGGNGYISNILTGNTQEIPPGSSSNTGYTGDVSSPTHVSDNDRQSYGEGWDPGNGTEGYSSPEGNVNTGAFESNTSANTSVGADTTDRYNMADAAANGAPQVDVPFTEMNPSASDTITNTGTTYVFPSFDTTDNALAIDDTASLWGGSESNVTVSGRYSNPNNYTLWKNNFETRTSDGAKIIGSSGGRTVDNILEGLLVAIYIRPDGAGGYDAGYIKLSEGGTLDGIFDPITGKFLAPDQNISAYHDDPTNILPEQLYWGSPYLDLDEEDAIGRADMGGDILLGSMSVSSLGLKNQEGHRYLWSIWKITAHGTYSAPLDSNWNAVEGGSDEYSDGDISYWLMNINGTEFADGKLRGSIMGRSLTYNSAHSLQHMTLDDISGEMIGTYNGGIWQALGMGTFDETPLQFAGETTHEYGVDYALFGGTDSLDSLWEGDSVSSTFIGDFSVTDVPSYDLWRFHLLGKTLDGGAMYAMARGMNVDNRLSGLLRALYIRPDPSSPGQYLAGYISSNDIAGTIYPDISMFDAASTLTAAEMGTTTVTPDNLTSSIHLTDLHGMYMSDLIGYPDRGSFGADEQDEHGIIQADGFEGSILNIADQGWGIWSMAMSGSYTGRAGSTDWQISDLTASTASASTGIGDGSWLGQFQADNNEGPDNQFSGILNAIWIALHKDGIIEGIRLTAEFAGNYIEVDTGAGDGTWRAVALGEGESDYSNLLIGELAPDVNLDANVIALGSAANIPITVAYSSLLMGANGNLTSVTMDTHLYNIVGGGDGIWAAIINGSYLTPPTDSWSVTVANGADNATLSGPAWSAEGRWIADHVSGTVGGSTITGQAAGTYGSGVFTGAGTGTFEQHPD